MAEILTDYFTEVGKHQLLSRAEEVELAKAIEKGDQWARSKMIESNLRLAISIARKYQNKGCSLEDLIQESNMGLIKAVDRFDWRKGFKFSTYAVWWIRQAVQSHVASHSASIKLPAHARGLLWKAKEMSEQFEEEFGYQPEDTEVAAMMGIPVNTLRSLRESASPQVRLDKPVGGEDGNRLLFEILPDKGLNHPDVEIDRELLRGIIRKHLSSLSPREEKIIRLRFGITEDDYDCINFPLSNEEYKQLKARKGAK